jgi:hypothetical protein
VPRVQDFTDPALRERLCDWAREQLAALGRAAFTDVEQPHAYPWGTVLRLGTPEGSLWLKASTPALAHEGDVIAVLAARRPDLVPELLARDGQRGLMLQADAGRSLRQLATGGDVEERWSTLLPLYAELQLAVAADRDALVAAGAPDRGAALLPRRLAEVLEDEEPLRRSDAALDDEALGRLRALVPTVEEAAARLAAVGVPESVQHDDLHDGQVFVRDGRYRFLDWGDACVAHPFLSLAVTERVLRISLELDEGTIGRLRDAYLEPFTVHAPAGALRASLPDARLLGRICRALTWGRILADLEGQGRARYADGLPGWLALALEPDA